MTGDSLCKDPIQIAGWLHRNENIHKQIKSLSQVHLVRGAWGGRHISRSSTEQSSVHIAARPLNVTVQMTTASAKVRQRGKGKHGEINAEKVQRHNER